jgi:hypothetical protein
MEIRIGLPPKSAASRTMFSMRRVSEKWRASTRLATA